MWKREQKKLLRSKGRRTDSKQDPRNDGNIGCHYLSRFLCPLSDLLRLLCLEKITLPEDQSALETSRTDRAECRMAIPEGVKLTPGKQESRFGGDRLTTPKRGTPQHKEKAGTSINVYKVFNIAMWYESVHI